MHEELASIYIEVDEHQHQRYNSTCELARLYNIAISREYQRPLVVLRYNPDPSCCATIPTQVVSV